MRLQKLVFIVSVTFLIIWLMFTICFIVSTLFLKNPWKPSSCQPGISLILT